MLQDHFQYPGYDANFHIFVFDVSLERKFKFSPSIKTLLAAIKDVCRHELIKSSVLWCLLEGQTKDEYRYSVHFHTNETLQSSFFEPSFNPAPNPLFYSCILGTSDVS